MDPIQIEDFTLLFYFLIFKSEILEELMHRKYFPLKICYSIVVFISLKIKITIITPEDLVRLR